MRRLSRGGELEPNRPKRASPSRGDWKRGKRENRRGGSVRAMKERVRYCGATMARDRVQKKKKRTRGLGSNYGRRL